MAVSTVIANGRQATAVVEAPAVIMGGTLVNEPSVEVPGDGPVKVIDGNALRQLGQNLKGTFDQYAKDRRIQELRWTKNLRQYLGYYDPEIESTLAAGRSRAYPKLTRVKCISMLSRIMDMMFPSDESNWTLGARPSAEMELKDVMAAIQQRQAADTAAGQQPPSPLTKDYVTSAVQALADKRARDLTTMIDDQLEELGGDQTYDYVQLNSEVVACSIMYGIGILCGPYVREVKSSTWDWDELKQQPTANNSTSYMPQFQFMSVWDFYPDLTAKRIENMDGYFIRHVMSKKQLTDLADRSDMFGDVIKNYLRLQPTGNYKAKEFETELRSMGVKANVNDQSMGDNKKYEVIVWHGPIDGLMLMAAGVEIDLDRQTDMIDAEVWMVDAYVIKASMNPWAELETDVKTLHTFIFDADDTAPIGFGLPNVLRDTQMAISASTRMMMDNASVVCGPMVELNAALLRADQDLSGLFAYKTWVRDDEGPSTSSPAVREIKVESHVSELQTIIELFMKMADIETFVGPMTGGDSSKMPSEPMRNLAGASMLMGNASLPFKQIIRNFDGFTKSVIHSLVQFNRQFNPERTAEADYGVIARGATSLIAKEVRGIQVDQLAASLKPEEMVHIDMRKLIEARLRVRDLGNMLVSPEEAAQRQSVQDQAAQLDTQLKQAGVEANTRYLLSQAFKNVAQGQKNQATANADAVDTALTIMESSAKDALTGAQTQQTQASAAQTRAQALIAHQGDPNAAGGQQDPAQDPSGGADQNDPGNADVPPVSGDPGAAGGGGMPAALLPPGSQPDGLPGGAGGGPSPGQAT